MCFDYATLFVENLDPTDVFGVGVQLSGNSYYSSSLKTSLFGPEWHWWHFLTEMCDCGQQWWLVVESKVDPGTTAPKLTVLTEKQNVWWKLLVIMKTRFKLETKLRKWCRGSKWDFSTFVHQRWEVNIFRCHCCWWGNCNIEIVITKHKIYLCIWLLQHIKIKQNGAMCVLVQLPYFYF